MLHKERQQEILEMLKLSNGFVSVRQLCDALFASESSIRRDLHALEERGLVKRSYGGASLVTNYSGVITFNRRTRQNTAAKRQIAQKAASLIEDGSLLFLDQSSTAFFLANELLNRSSLTVVTNNIEILMLLSNSAVRVIASGGVLSEENRNCLIGGDARRTFENIYADAVFFSVHAVTEDGIITDCTREEIEVRDAMLQNAAKKILLCDSTKFGIRSSYKQGELQDMDVLISEEDAALRFAAFEERVVLL